jgi:hypothetical protein
MADVDIADPQHKGQGSREFNRNCTSLLTLAQLRNCIVLLSGEAIDDISSDTRPLTTRTAQNPLVCN